MRYSQIVVYERVGDTVTPYRVSMAYGMPSALCKTVNLASSCKKLDWAELYGNHTSWVHDQVLQYEQAVTEYYNKKAA